ncbi:DNA polymerase III subunit delta [Tessaracoccus sp. OS52]|uniref:DNA polymerase III subunit delta n=1 Tax=Tessaracoccus sp. OS52 TaxID=2886691 RepID=UPI001D118743|nr:DNA polymerase III subunit delta [Tessaracoccus sp. OS52]MCC2592663.1 DNA polymerase III subunit delta [Tessaracoccus sp. OS52]
MTAFGTSLLVSGTEQLLAARIVDARRKAAMVEQPDAEVNRLDASELQGSMLAEVVGGSLFSSHIVAIIDDVGATPPEVVDQLVATAVNPGPDLCLILVHQGGNKGKGLLDKLKKAKVPVESVAPVKAWELPKFCQAEARHHRVSLTTDAANALISAIGTDLRALVSAISQLADDAGGEEIDAKLISRYFAGRADVTSFAVADAVLAGNSALAMERLRWALTTGAAPVLVTSAMAAAFRGMGKYLDAQGQRLGEYDLARQLGVPPWKLKDYSRNSRHWQSGGVATAIKLVAAADADVKGAATSAEYALERMVLGVLAQRRNAAG